MINLTTIQGMYYYINTFKEGTEKYDMLQGLKKTLNEYKHRNKSNFYIIFEEDKQLQIISHSIYTYKFSELVQSFNNCVFIDDTGIHLKEGDNITTYRVLLYDNVLKYLFSNLDERERAYYYSVGFTKLVNSIPNNLNRWYTMEDGQKIFTEYLYNDIKLIPRCSRCKNYVYFEDYIKVNNDKVKDITFNKELYNTSYYPCIMLIDNDGKDSFILRDIISNDKAYIDNKFNEFKLKCIEDGKSWNIDNSKLSYKII